MDQLDIEIAAYNRMRDYLEANHKGEWVIIHNEELIGAYQDFQIAADQAVRRFGRGPCLLRQVCAPPKFIPYYVRVNANS